jgi:hypothetical protein
MPDLMTETINDRCEQERRSNGKTLSADKQELFTQEDLLMIWNLLWEHGARDDIRVQKLYHKVSNAIGANNAN